MKKLLVSGCFMGNKVRYDGGDNIIFNQFLLEWKIAERLVIICPEVAGGLPTPREPAEIQYSKGQLSVRTILGEDVTSAFEAGAKKALSLCQHYGITHALLKESSPSCGSSTIYDGQFTNRKVTGAGVTTQLLRQHGINVYSENRLKQLIKDFN